MVVATILHNTALGSILGLPQSHIPELYSTGYLHSLCAGVMAIAYIKG